MFVFSGNVLAQDNPYLLLEEVASKTFDRIKTSQKKIKSNPEELKAIVEEELLPYIDYQFAALKVLGKYFRKVPKERIPEYIEVFRTYLIATYAIALGQYEDQTVEFEPPKDYDKRKDVTVRAIISDGERPDIKIAFKVRRNSKTNEWKAYDMVAEGISLLSSKRSELEGILRQDGIEKVIEELSKKNSQPISLQKETAEG
nr:ABC transporter substrate-binding protein [Alteromonas sp. a30]